MTHGDEEQVIESIDYCRAEVQATNSSSMCQRGRAHRGAAGGRVRARELVACPQLRQVPDPRDLLPRQAARAREAHANSQASTLMTAMPTARSIQLRHRNSSAARGRPASAQHGQHAVTVYMQHVVPEIRGLEPGAGSTGHKKGVADLRRWRGRLEVSRAALTRCRRMLSMYLSVSSTISCGPAHMMRACVRQRLSQHHRPAPAACRVRSARRLGSSRGQLARGPSKTACQLSGIGSSGRGAAARSMEGASSSGARVQRHTLESRHRGWDTSPCHGACRPGPADAGFALRQVSC